jgi:Bacteriophage probable baseplate hub protein
MPAPLDLVQLSADSAHRSFFAPHFELRIAGVSAPESVVRDIIQISYKDNVKEIDSVDITLSNWDPETNRHKYIGSETQADVTRGGFGNFATMFEPRAERFEVRLGYADSLGLVSTVTMVSMEPNFAGSGASTLQVRGLNELHQFRRKQNNDAWFNEKPSAIAKKVGDRRLPIKVKTLEPPPQEQPIPFIAQKNQHDIDFLLSLARMVDYDLALIPQDGATPAFLLFAPSTRIIPKKDIALAWGESLVDFRPRLTTSNQVAKVTVQGWDRARKKPIKVTVDLKDQQAQKLNPDLHRLVDNSEVREEIVVDEPVFSEADARQRARAILADRLKQMVTAEGTTVGLPELRAGGAIEINNLGARLNGRYFVEETTHTLSDAGYTTKFKARRESPRSGA